MRDASDGCDAEKQKIFLWKNVTGVTKVISVKTFFYLTVLLSAKATAQYSFFLWPPKTIFSKIYLKKI